jgi:RND family efflux transporter MFP subunit
VADQPLLPGQAVRAGVVLGRIVALSADPGSITADKARADADLALAERAAERAESLYPTFVSARERDEARADVEAARARVAALSGGLEAWRGRGGAGFQIASPFDGRVAFVHVDPGDVVEAGVPVVSLIDATQLWLEARVFEGDHASVKGTQGAMVTVTGRDEPLVIDSSMGGEVVAVGAAVDPRDRTFPVVFAFPNPGDLVPGMMVKVKVFGTESRDVVAVPAASVIDDGGFPTVFVLDGGESFFKRRVVVGIRDGQLVEIVSGVAEGERVVSGGAWEVHLATTSGGIPEHGHQH